MASRIFPPLPPGEVRDGHRRLLATFGELAGELADGPEENLDADVLRALVAFLRHGLLPFARHEDAAPAACPDVAEDVAFEHSFLAAETEVLADAARAVSLSPADTPVRRAAQGRVRRQLHRIGAVLELHVQKAEAAQRGASA